jgi:hypothetical protein
MITTVVEGKPMICCTLRMLALSLTIASSDAQLHRHYSRSGGMPQPRVVLWDEQQPGWPAKVQLFRSTPQRAARGKAA